MLIGYKKKFFFNSLGNLEEKNDTRNAVGREKDGHSGTKGPFTIVVEFNPRMRYPPHPQNTAPNFWRKKN